MALVLFEVLLLGASMVRVQEHGRIVPYSRAIPFMPMALAVPVASILVTLGLAYLLKMLAAASGAEAIHLAPPTAEPTRIVRSADVLQGEIVRTPEFSAGGHADPAALDGLDGQTSTWVPSQLAQTGQPRVVVGNSRLDQVEATKRRQVEAHLATLKPDQQQRLHQLGPRAAARELTSTLNRQGLAVSERYVQQIWDVWTHTSGQRGSGRPGGSQRKR